MGGGDEGAMLRFVHHYRDTMYSRSIYCRPTLCLSLVMYSLLVSRVVKVLLGHWHGEDSMDPPTSAYSIERGRKVRTGLLTLVQSLALVASYSTLESRVKYHPGDFGPM